MACLKHHFINMDYFLLSLLLVALASPPMALAQRDRAEYWTIYCEDGATINSVDLVASELLGWFKVSSSTVYSTVAIP